MSNWIKVEGEPFYAASCNPLWVWDGKKVREAYASSTLVGVIFLNPTMSQIENVTHYQPQVIKPSPPEEELSQDKE